MSDNFYRAFEERYRGPRELIKERLRAYQPFIGPLAMLYPCAPVLDLGCGRGEWLELMTEVGFAAVGVDLDEGMLAACRERGLHVEIADALSTLRARADASVAMVSAFHLVEHLPYEQVQELVSEALRILLPGGLLILETPNPENLIIGTTNFYLDPSHLRPVPPMLLAFTVEYQGFKRHTTVRLQESAPLGDTHDVGVIQLLEGVSPDYSVVAQKLAESALATPFDAAFGARYGISLMEMAQQFDLHTTRQIAQLRDAIQRIEHDAAPRALTQQDQLGAVQALPPAHAAQWNADLGNLNRGHAALVAQATAQDAAIAGTDLALRKFAEDFDQRINRFEAANNHQLQSVVDAVQAQFAALNADVERERGPLRERLAAIEAEVAHAERHATMTDAWIQNIDHLEAQRAAEFERRLAQSQRRVASMALRLSMAEGKLRETANKTLLAQKENALVTAAELRAAQADDRATQLEDHIKAMVISSSWRATAPARAVARLTYRILAARRERRLASAMQRRLLALAGFGVPVERKWSSRLLARAKRNEMARRIAIPLLYRFPKLKQVLRRYLGPVAAEAAPSGNIELPCWPDPLPAEFLQMPHSSRKVLLDLARPKRGSQCP